MYIALDANILIQNQAKKNQNMRILNDYVRKTESKILIHEIVEAEMLGHIEENVLKDFRQMEATFHNLEKYKISILPNIEIMKFKNKAVKKIKKEFLDNLYMENTLRVNIDGKALRQVIRRSIERRRPCSKNGEELRDAIIWLNLLKYCKKHHQDLTFISNNTNDFADDDKRTLHDDLIEDTKHHKLNVKYFVTLDDFLKEHAEPIARITFEWVNERIDFEEAKSIIMSYLSYNEVANYFALCDELERNYFIPDGEAEFPSWFSPEIEFEDFFVWGFDDKHIELNLVFYIYVEAEFKCIPKNPSTIYQPYPSWQDSYYSSWHDSYSCSHTTISEKRICFSDLKFRISAKLENEKILLENVEDLFRA